MRTNQEPFELEEAVQAFLDLRRGYGDTVDHSEVWAILGLIEPLVSSSAGWAKEQELKRLTRWGELKTALLTRHDIDLKSVHGLGYRLVEPEEQVELAMIDTRRKAQKILAHGLLRVRHVNRFFMDDSLRQMQADAQSKLAQWQATIRKPRGSDW